MLAGFEDDTRLLDRLVRIGGNADKRADGAEVFAGGDGQRDQPDLRVAGFGELGGLGDVFCDGEPVLELLIEAEVLERLLRGEAIRSVCGVRDREMRQARVL